jgi:high-affinity nickel-transport protein
MFLVGLLFGLGFDTATEVAVYALSIAQVTHGASPWTVLLLPALFAAGMCLVDTTDGVLMLGAYAWAFIEPRRKLTYNLIVTLLSAIAALVVASIEVFGLIGDRLGRPGSVWNAISVLNTHSGEIGALIIGMIALVWLCYWTVTTRVSGVTGRRLRVPLPAEDDL